MVRSHTVRVVLMVVVAAGCSRVPSRARAPVKGQGAEPTRTRPTLYVPGERMVLELRWLNVLMGNLTVVVGQPGVVGGRSAIVVRSELRSDGMLAVIKQARAEMATMIDLGDGLPIAITGSFDDLYAGDVLDESYKGTPVNLPWKPYQRELAGGVPAYETLSALGMLRAWNAGSGDRLHFYGKVNGLVFRTDVVSNGREVIKTAAGRVATIRLDGIVTPALSNLTREHSNESYRWIMWLSDDAHRAPVRLHVQSGYGGTVQVDLVDYDAGDSEPL